MPIYFPPSSGGGGSPDLGPNLTALEALSATGIVNHLSEGVYEAVPISTFMKGVLDDTDASTARSTLGLTIGTNVQAYDIKLNSFSGLSPTTDTIPYFTSSTLMGTTALTSFARSILDDSDASTVRTTLGIVIGTDVQEYNANLTALGGLTSAANKLPYFTGSETASVTDISPFGRSLIDDADNSAARTTLGLGTIATQYANNVTITGGTIDGTPVGGTTQAVGKFTNVTTNTYMDFTPTTAPAHNHGRVWFDSDDDSLSYQPASSNATMNIGKELWVTSKNSTGSTINNGTPVYINGAVGASGKPTIAKADASLINKSYLLGVVTEDITNGSMGQVTVVGLVRNLDTSAYNEGDTLYVSAVTPGTFTTTKPSAPNYSIPIARVINSHANNGTIIVLPSTPMLGFGLANQLRGMNSAGTAEEYKSVTGSGNVVMDTGPTISNPTLTGTINTPLTSGSIVFAGAGGALSEDTSNLVWDNTNNRLGVNTSTPTASLEIVGNIRLESTGTDVNDSPVIMFGTNTITANNFGSSYYQFSKNIAQTANTGGTSNSVSILLNQDATSTQNITTMRGSLTRATTTNGATGTITTLIGAQNGLTHSAAGTTVTNGLCLDLSNTQQNSSAYTNFAGLRVWAIPSSPAPTNASYVIFGQSTIPDGNWGIYGNYSYNNYLGTGSTLINTTTDSGSGARLQVNGSIEVGAISSTGNIVTTGIITSQSLPVPTKYVLTFNATTDWGSAGGGFYSLTVLQTAHKAVSPTVQIFELSGSDYDVVMVDRIRINSSGDVTIRVPETPDGRFAGKIIIM